MIIYSDDPRGIKHAMAEELEKNPGVQIHLKNAAFRPTEASPDVLEEKPVVVSKMTKAELQDALSEKGVWFESDANKDRLIELLEGAE